MSKNDSLEALYYVWGIKPIDHLFSNEVGQFYEDLSLANITETEYLEYARNKEKECLKDGKVQIIS